MKTTSKIINTVTPRDLLTEFLPSKSGNETPPEFDAILENPSIKSIDWVLAWAVTSARTTSQVETNIEYAICRMRRALDLLQQITTENAGPLYVSNGNALDESICHSDERRIFNAMQGGTD